MTISQVDICNKALGHIGVEKIASLDEDSAPAIAIKPVYSSVLEAVLREHWWGFATAIKTLAQVSGASIPGWSYVYTYPADCVMIRKIFADTSIPYPEAEQHEVALVTVSSSSQKAIAANISPAYMRYTKNVTDPAFYDPSFVEALSFRLAAEVAYTLTKERTLKAEMLQNYQFAVSQAYRSNLIERNVDEKKDSSFESSRA